VEEEEEEEEEEEKKGGFFSFLAPKPKPVATEGTTKAKVRCSLGCEPSGVGGQWCLLSCCSLRRKSTCCWGPGKE